MKPKKFEKKLDLSKVTISNLENSYMDRVKGGVTWTELPYTQCNQYTCERYCTFPPPKGNCTQ